MENEWKPFLVNGPNYCSLGHRNHVGNWCTRSFIIVPTAETYDAPVPKSVVGMLKVFLGTHPTEVNSNFVPSNASYPANHFTFPITWTWTGISYWKSFRYLSPFGKWDGGYFPVHCIAWVSGKAHSNRNGGLDTARARLRSHWDAWNGIWDALAWNIA